MVGPRSWVNLCGCWRCSTSSTKEAPSGRLCGAAVRGDRPAPAAQCGRADGAGGQVLSAVQIINHPEILASVIAEAGEAP